MTRLETAVQSGGNSAFSMTYAAGFPAEILSRPNPFSEGNTVRFDEIIHPDDYMPFCEVMNEIINNRTSDVKFHARIKADGDYKWYYISALAVRDENDKLKELDGMMFDVSDYLEGCDDDAVMRRYRSKKEERFTGASAALGLDDILGEDYLARMQRPFAQIDGLLSAIVDAKGKIIAAPENQDKRENLNKLSYQRSRTIRVRHQDIAQWIIAAEDEALIKSNYALLDTMAQTVADIANSYVVLGEEMENSQNANKLLGQNFEDSILINNIYSIVLESDTTNSAIGKVIPLVSDYFGLVDIMFMADEDEHVRVYRWDSSGMLLPVVGDVPHNDEIMEQLTFGGVVTAEENELLPSVKNPRSYALCRTYEKGRSNGVIMFISRTGGRSWSNRERKQLRTLTQILSTIINKSFTESELRTSQERLEKLAYYDFTTNIPNRSLFELKLQKEIESGGNGAVIALEIANLKSISEINSIEYADDILRSCAEYIAAIPSEAVKRVYRFSNDILFVLMRGSTREEARQLAQAILTKFHSPWYLNGNEHHLEVYAGLTLYPDDAFDTAGCIRAATHTLRLAKDRKLSDAVIYSEGLEEQLNDNLLVKKLIQDSAENNFKGFYCLYQPVLDINTGALHCCEARVFWGNENMTVSSERYNPIIERMGYSIRLFGFIADKVCEFCSTVRQKGYKGFRVSIAIPENVLANDACIAALRSALMAYGLPPSALSIAVSESANTLQHASLVLKQLGKIGVNIIAEDSGDSFFTTATLENENIRTVKIRASRFTDDPVAIRYMRSVINMAHDRKIAVCVREIDNAETLERVKRYEVDFVEGIYNGRPIHSSEFMEKLIPQGK